MVNAATDVTFTQFRKGRAITHNPLDKITPHTSPAMTTYETAQPHSCRLASAAPCASASSFAQAMSG